MGGAARTWQAVLLLRSPLLARSHLNPVALQQVAQICCKKLLSSRRWEVASFKARFLHCSSPRVCHMRERATHIRALSPDLCPDLSVSPLKGCHPTAPACHTRADDGVVLALSLLALAFSKENAVFGRRGVGGSSPPTPTMMLFSLLFFAGSGVIAVHWFSSACSV